VISEIDLARTFLEKLLVLRADMKTLFFSFLLHPRNYYELSLCNCHFSVIYLTIYGNLEEHMPSGDLDEPFA